MNVDLINVWPKHLDYPPFRLFLQRYGIRFRSIITIFSEHNIASWDYQPFFHKWILDQREKHFPHTNVVVDYTTTPLIGNDWRNAAVNLALRNSTADYVWFIEQDFLANWVRFIDRIEIAINQDKPIIGFYENGRLHPACLIIKRSLLNTTDCDFSARPPEYDHFDWVTHQLDLRSLLKFEDWGLARGVDWYHMAGLTQNYQQVLLGGKPNYNLNEFLVYNSRSRNTPVAMLNEYKDLTYKVEGVTTTCGGLLD